jgi:2-keto-4-pentenoate hydratase/2-oxohepta-3-ene-1,7-dioic acid hydratase in catechol pathway
MTTEPDYRLLTFLQNGTPTAGVLVDGHVHAAEELLRDCGVRDARSVTSLLDQWQLTHEAIKSALRSGPTTHAQPIARIKLLAPILYPGGIFCAGANYWDHVEEMEGSVDRTCRARDPWFFLKTSAHSVVADGAIVHRPRDSTMLDYEAELAVVIGRTAMDVPVRDTSGVIAGYTIINDLSARDLMKQQDRPPAMTFDWIGQKCFAGAAPLGPWITPAEFVTDCHNLDIRLSVNGILKQRSNTANMIHNVYEQVSWLSHHLTLRPGDVIATGTPAGVGMPRGDFLQDGDVVHVEIAGLGSLTTYIGRRDR